MKRVFVILTALTTILSFSCTFLIAQESGEKPREAEKQEIEEKQKAERLKEKASLGRRIRQKKRMRERPERLYEKLFAELERQSEEIRALREEIAALREMLKEQYDLKKVRRGRRWRARQRRWAPERKPFREHCEPERRDIRREFDIEREMRELEEKVERRPDDIELRMRLAHTYLEVDRIGAAIEEYRAIMEINPDFDPPYRALEELKRKFPDMFREEERPLEDSTGEVISANKEEIKLKTLEGDIVTFRVPYRETDDGSLVLNEDFSEFAKSLNPGVRVKILWYEEDEHKFIHRIERTKE